MGQAKRKAERAQAIRATVTETIGRYETALTRLRADLSGASDAARVMALAGVLAETLRRSPWDYASARGLAVMLPLRDLPRPPSGALLPDAHLEIAQESFAALADNGTTLAAVVESASGALITAANDAADRTVPPTTPWRELVDALCTAAGRHASAVVAIAITMATEAPDGGLIFPAARMDNKGAWLLIRRRDGNLIATPAIPDHASALRARIDALEALGTRPPPAYRRFEQRLAKCLANIPMDMRIAIFAMLLATVTVDAFGDDAKDVLITLGEMHPPSDEFGPSPAFDPGEIYDFVADDIPLGVRADLRVYIEDVLAERREEFGALLPEIIQADGILDEMGAWLCAVSWLLDSAGAGRAAIAVTEATANLPDILDRIDARQERIAVEIGRHSTLDAAQIGDHLDAMRGDA